MFEVTVNRISRIWHSTRLLLYNIRKTFCAAFDKISADTKRRALGVFNFYAISELLAYSSTC